MATFEAYIEALKALQIQTAADALDPNRNTPSEFRYGQVCGIQQGLRLAEELLNKQLQEVDNDGTDERGHPKNRRR